MVKKISLEAKLRTEASGRAKILIHQGFIPVVVYGAGIENQKLKIKISDFEFVFAQAGETHLIDLNVDGTQKYRVLVKDVQRDPIKGKIIHADFYQVDMKKPIEVQVPLQFIGESKAIKELGGTLVKSIDVLSVKCLPEDLVDKIDVDISVLETYDNAITVKDLPVPEELEVLNNPDDMVVHVMAPTIEEVAPAPAPEGEVPVAGEEQKAEGAEIETTGEKSEKSENK